METIASSGEQRLPKDWFCGGSVEDFENLEEEETLQ